MPLACPSTSCHLPWLNPTASQTEDEGTQVRLALGVSGAEGGLGRAW